MNRNAIPDTQAATTLDFGPRGTIEARRRMVRAFGRDGSLRDNIRSGREAGLFGHLVVDDDRVADAHRDTIGMSQLIWISPEMCDLIEHASATIPASTRIFADTAPFLRGLAFFARPLIGIDAVHPGFVRMAALSWSPLRRQPDRDSPESHELDMNWYSYFPPFLADGRAVPQARRWMIIGGSEWQLGATLDTAPNPSALEDRRYLMTMFALLTSPGIARIDNLPPATRAERRRSAREPSLPGDDVRIVYLRRETPNSHNATVADGREYHHRWIVSGHWRMQPCGRGGRDRRATWIAPHLKGPEGAPMLNSIRALVR